MIAKHQASLTPLSAQHSPSLGKALQKSIKLPLLQKIVLHSNLSPPPAQEKTARTSPWYQNDEGADGPDLTDHMADHALIFRSI